MFRCQPVDRSTRNILSQNMHRAHIEVPDELAQIIRRRRAVVVVIRDRGVAEATEIDGEHPVTPRQQRNQSVERPP
ncbi:hypothetical protein GOAMI_07_02180 [Gordonia amicalis NBRC 100051 = JCM 11271]|nr:hypothetical protein GOAMI_07_02180 [Gordonia amicalis NBRC 100051 = JCM 11271]